MSNAGCELIAELRVLLTRQQYSPVVVGNYCAYARRFLDHLARRNILVADVSEVQVAQYLRDAIALFRKRHGRPPGPYWHSIPRSGIHMLLLRLAQGQWPPAPKVTCASDAVRFTICDEYETWLREERGLVQPSIVALLWEARHFLAWQFGRYGAESLMELNVGNIDHYMDLRAPKLTRKSLKDVAERLRSCGIYTGPVAPRSTCHRTSSPRCSTPMRGSPRSWSAVRSLPCWRVRERIRHRWGCGTMRSCNCSRPMA